MIGVIADDFSGATDVAVAFSRKGLRTLLYFGVPNDTVFPALHDAVVVALKSRMAPVGEAVSDSLSAMDWLRRHGSDRFYFKYCSTFDSTNQGNSGPVLDALSDALGGPTVVTTPSSPEHGRTQYMGYLFVEDTILADSHMAHHPLTPMTDSSVSRLLSRQTRKQVELITLAVVRQGTEAIRSAVADATSRGSRYVLVDAVEPGDLDNVGLAVVDHPMVAGAAGLARALAAATVRSATSIVGDTGQENIKHTPDGNAAVLAGSCSDRTLHQIDVLVDAGHPTFYLDPTDEPEPVRLAATALRWFDKASSVHGGLAPGFYSSARQDELERVQKALGARRSAAILEETMGRIAVGLVGRGVKRLVAAGGETCGAIVSALGVTSGFVGHEVAPGVPWILVSQRELALLLKSGNFGPTTLFVDATAEPTVESAP
jgi:uncharacterized protein YgbK (DUF1537 family)